MHGLKSLQCLKSAKTRKPSRKKKLAGRLRQQGILNILASITDNNLYKTRVPFDDLLKAAFKGSGEKWSGKFRESMLLSLAQEDKTAEPFHTAKGDLVPDPKLRDTENVDFPADITLPLPLDYPDKKNKGKLDNKALLALVKGHCEQYLKEEVLPYRDDAWIDHNKTKVGYEIPFNPSFLPIPATSPIGRY